MRRAWVLGLAACALAPIACDPEVASDALDEDERRVWTVSEKKVDNLRVATFNIRNYPAEPPPADGSGEVASSPSTHAEQTDEELLLDVLERLDFDVLAVQEIRDPAALEALLVELGERTGATYAAAFSTNAASGNDQQVGIVARADKVALTDVREHPEVDVKGTLRAGLSARLASVKEGGLDTGIMVLHLASGDSAKRAALRAEQAKAAATIVAELTAERADGDFIVLGDLNTAREEAELGGLDDAFAGAELGRLDNASGCTSYYVKNKLGAVAPSWIDQVYVASLAERDAEVELVSGAHCFERSCQAFESDEPGDAPVYWGVSDHCPVYFEVADADRDDGP